MNFRHPDAGPQLLMTWYKLGIIFACCASDHWRLRNGHRPHPALIETFGAAIHAPYQARRELPGRPTSNPVATTVRADRAWTGIATGAPGVLLGASELDHHSLPTRYRDPRRPLIRRPAPPSKTSYAAHGDLAASASAAPNMGLKRQGSGIRARRGINSTDRQSSGTLPRAVPGSDRLANAVRRRGWHRTNGGAASRTVRRTLPT